MKIIAQLIGMIGMAVAIFSFQCKKNKTFFVCQAASGAAFAVNFLMLGSITASVLNGLNVLRGCAFALIPEKYHKGCSVGLMLLYVVSTILTYGGWLSLLVLAAQLVGTIAMLTNNGKTIRILQFCIVSPIWLFHNIWCGSLGGILCESFNLVSIVVALIRYGTKGFEK